MPEEEEIIKLQESGMIALSKMAVKLVEGGYDLDKDDPNSIWQAAGFLVGKDEYGFSVEEIAVLLTFITEHWEEIKEEAFD